MLDIIIPTYKNKEGLRKTLASINNSLENITITVIDDCSNIYYDDILEEFPFIQISYLQQNSGPGNARQYGITITTEPYIMFLDTGDYFISNDVQQIILQTIANNPNTVMYSWQYENNGKISEETNNRLHGRVYKREFLQKYNITFCNESSFSNEDIGFNRLCRLIIKDKQLELMNLKEPAIIYSNDTNSITRKNNYSFFYKEQNYGLALNSIHVVKKAKQNNISKELLAEEIGIIMASLYYTFLCTIHVRPEYSQEAWKGAKLYYDTIFNKSNIDDFNIQNGYRKYIKLIFQKKKNWKRNYPINYTRFLNDLSKYEKIPYWYN